MYQNVYSGSVLSENFMVALCKVGWLTCTFE